MTSISQSLATRTADFLKDHPPFLYLPPAELEALAARAQIRYYGERDYIFEEGKPPRQEFYVLNKGQVELYHQDEGENRLIDVCDEGDCFGVRSLLSDNPYVATAIATEDSLVYVIPKDQFMPLLERHPRVSMYFAAGFAAGMTIVRAAPRAFDLARKELMFRPQSASLFREEDVVLISPHEEVVFCTPLSSIREAAEIVAEYRVGSIVVADASLFPIGIVTSTDFARKVATGRYRLEQPVTAIMSGPVVTLPRGATMAQVLLTMMKHHVRHIVFTEDGTPQSRFIGIVSEHDVLTAQGNNPAILVKQMMKARSPREMADIRNRAGELMYNYLRQEISIPFVTATITEINDALITRAVELSLQSLERQGLPQPPLRFCWLSLGSEGRGEQILRTDQDNALLYEDPPEALAGEAAAYFLKLGTAITDILEACGFAHCPGEVMASNPQWNQPLSGWKRHFSRWIGQPEPKALMHGTIFFDFRPAWGDFHLAEELSEHLLAEMARQEGFIHFLAQNALENPPPLSFLKNFIVERGGKHKDEFDIKLRGMMPLTDAARVLLLHHRVTGITNTLKRYERLAELEPKNATLYEEAATAYGLMLRYRAVNGFETSGSGRYLNPDALNKIERQTLKYAFRTIEELHSLIRTRFSLHIFGS